MRTYKWLCLKYFKSADFQRLDPQTQRTREGIIEHTWAEPLKPGSAVLIGDCPLDQFNAKIVRVLRDRKAKLNLPHAANGRLKVLSRLFKWAVENEHLDTNPVRDVERVKAKSGGHHSWTDAEIAQFENRWPIGTKSRLAFALLRYLGVRRSDVVRLGPQHVKDGWLCFTVHKGRNSNPTPLELPMPPALKAILDASETGDLAFLLTGYGKGFAVAGFGNWFRDQCNEAGLPQCSAHGLRKAAATALADAGATGHQLMAWFGWKSLKQAEVYTRAANQKRLAGSVVHLVSKG